MGKAFIRRFPRVLFLIRVTRRLLSRVLQKGSGGKKTRFFDISFHSDTANANWFCGYYDHSPFNANDESLVLLHSTTQSAWKNPSPRSSASILLYDWKNKRVVKSLGQTFAWNWQQGSRAQWIDPETVIYNIYDEREDRFKSRIVNIDGKWLKDLPIPVQEVDSQGRVYSLSYEALASMRPDYGYRNRSTGERDILDNAIEQIEPSTGRRRVIIRVSDLMGKTQARHKKTIVGAWFNHVMVSPDARQMVFLLRYFMDGQRITDLYQISTEGGAASLLSGNEGVSHVCWWNNEAIVATMRGVGGFGYYFLPVDGLEKPRLLWSQLDGHPNRVNEHNILTDTYPNKSAIRHLLIHSIENGRTFELGAFSEPLLFHGETRCDLHPSLSPSRRYIQVDCAVGNRRRVAIMDNPLFVGREV